MRTVSAYEEHKKDWEELGHEIQSTSSSPKLQGSGGNFQATQRTKQLSLNFLTTMEETRPFGKTSELNTLLEVSG